MGRGVPPDAWRPLKSVRKSWATSAKDAGIEKPRRFHDVRGAYIRLGGYGQGLPSGW